MTITFGYVTLAEAKARLWPSTAEADTTEDTLIEDLITFASRKIDDDTEHRFYTTAADETRYYTPLWYDCIYEDIVSITTLQTDEDGDGVFENTWTIDDDYVLLPHNAALDGDCYNKIQIASNGAYRFPANRHSSVKIVGKFGHATSVVTEVRTFTAPNASFCNVDDLISIALGGLTTDNNNDTVFETTWTAVTDYALIPVTGTPTTWITKAGSKSFPITADCVKVNGSWGVTGAPAQIKEACLIKVQIEYTLKGAFGGATIKTTIDDLEKRYQDLIYPFMAQV